MELTPIPEENPLDDVDDFTRGVEERVKARQLIRRQGGVLSPKGPTVGERIGRGVTTLEEASASGLSMAGEEFVGGGRDIVEAARGFAANPITIPEDRAPDTGDLNVREIGKMLLGGLRTVFGPVAGVARTGRGAIVDAPSELLSNRPPGKPPEDAGIMKRLTQGAVETGLNLALPMVPGVGILNKIRSARLGAEAPGAMKDIVAAEEFIRESLGISAGRAIASDLMEKAPGGGYKLTEKGMREVARSTVGPGRIDHLALPETGGGPFVGPGAPGEVGPIGPAVPSTKVRAAPEARPGGIRELLDAAKRTQTGGVAEGTGGARTIGEAVARDPITGRVVLGASDKLPPKAIPVEDRLYGPTKIGQGEQGPPLPPMGEGPRVAPTVGDTIKTNEDLLSSIRQRLEGVEGPSREALGETAKVTRRAAADPRVSTAKVEPPEIQDAMPTKVLEEISATKGAPEADRVPWLSLTEGKIKGFFQPLKSFGGVNSMTQISKGDSAYSEIIRITKMMTRDPEMKWDVDVWSEMIAPLRKEIANSNRAPVVKKDVENYIRWISGEGRTTEDIAGYARNIRSYEYIRTIGGNVLSPLWNTTQRSLTFAETSTKNWLKAYGDEVAFYRNDPEIMRIMKEGKLEREVVQLGPSADLPTEVLDAITNLPRELGKTEAVLTKVAKVTGAGFRLSERGNRVHAFFAGFRDGIDKGMSEVDAIQYGHRIMERTQFTAASEASDIAPRLRGEAARTFGQFKMFQIKYGEYVTNNLTDIVKGGGEGRWAASQKFAKFWGSQLALSGTGALGPLSDVVEEKIGRLPDIARRGAAGSIGLALSEQVGLGIMPFESIRTLMYSIPGPAVQSFQDVAALVTGRNTGNGFDVANFGKNLTPDEYAQRITRAFPAGTQLNRLRRAVQLSQTGGEVRKSEDILQAFGVGEQTGDKLVEARVNFMIQALGFREEGPIKERKLREKLDTNRMKASEAVKEAIRLMRRGESGADVLDRARASFGLPEGVRTPELEITPEKIAGEQERRMLSPLQRRLKTRTPLEMAVMGPEEE